MRAHIPATVILLAASSAATAQPCNPWEVVPSPNAPGADRTYARAIKALAPDDVWFVGDGHPTANGPQPALAMHWDGSGFTLTEVPIVNPEAGRDAGNPLHDIAVVAPNDIWVVGGTDVNADGADDYSQIHHWNGSSWTHVPGPTPGFFNQLWCVAAPGPDDVWAAGEYWDVSGIHPLLIHWDGSSWTEVPAPGGFLDMVALAPDDIWAVGNGVFHYDGESWSFVQNFPEAPYPALAGVSAVEPCEIWAAGRQIEGDTGFMTLVVRTTGGAEGGCAPDWDGDGGLNSSDISAFLAAWLGSVQGGTLAADFSGDGAVNSADVSAFLAAWLDAVQGGC